MAKEIRQRNIVRDVKTIDRSKLLSGKLRRAGVKTGTDAVAAAENHLGEHDAAQSGEGYAESKAESAAKETVDTGISLMARPGANRRLAADEGNGKVRTRQRMQNLSESRKAKREAAHSVADGGAHASGNSNLPQANARRKAVAIKERSAASKPKQRVHAKPVKPVSRRAAGGAAQARMKQKLVTEQAKHAAVKTAQRKAAAKSAKAAAAAFLRSVRAILTALRSLVLAIASGGAVAVICVILIIAVAAILGSAFGIFFADETGDGVSMKGAVRTLTEEYADMVEEIKAANAHDELEMAYIGGDPGIDWKQVLSIYAVKTSEDTANPTPVIVFDEANMARLKAVMNDMNIVAYATRTETMSRTVAITDPDTGEETEITEYFDVTILTITTTKKSADVMALQYGFSKSQRETLAELLSPDNDSLWEGIIGGFTSASGMGVPWGGQVPTGIFSWPLQEAGTITSWFGWRQDPFTGEWAYHGGTDIAVPNGTPILAAADGVVTVANGTDSYAGGLGYYVRISHAGGFESLCAHCSAIAVRGGDTVVQGQIIGYVGSTGRSTGNHLHWEVYLNGVAGSALDYFA
jgi:murein DD-endopeptidase MepM/ murein hydrolase activator NlpD